MKSTILTILFICFHLLLYSQSPDDVIKDFFSTYHLKGSNVALVKLFSSNKWMEQRNKDDIENIKSQLNAAVQLMGNYYGYEKITQKSIGDTFILYSYIVKYDRQPLRFIFVFYKALDKWSIFNFKYDDNLSNEIEESARVYWLKD